MIQSPGFSSSPDEELNLSVNKNINPKTSALKVTKSLQNFRAAGITQISASKT